MRFDKDLGNTSMYKNYLRIALRNLIKYKSYSFINILGLAVGLASCLLIFLFVYHELSYDSFHTNAHQIFRANLRFNMGSNEFDVPLCPVPLGPTMMDEYPEVVTTTRLFTMNYRNKDVYVKYQEKQFKENSFLWADSTVSEVFTIKFLSGDDKSALKYPNSVVITPQTAEKYFGEDDPLGKIFVLQDSSLYTVTGIVEELPSNSHFKFDFLASFSSLKKSRDPEWYDTAVYTYIVLQKNYSWEILDGKLPGLSQKYVAPIIEQAMGMSYDNFLQAGNYFGFFLEPLLDIHLYSKVSDDIGTPGNINTVIIFTAIALLILLVACINFINLSTARSALRANEVGVRKVAGSTRGQLIRQFLAESVIYSLISLFLAIIIVEIALPYMNNYIAIQLTSTIWTIQWFPVLLVFSAILLGVISGIYPAFLLSAFKPIDIFRGKLQTGGDGKKFRNSLALIQFATSIVLIVGTIVIYNQLQYVRNKDLGFNKEQIVIIPNAARLADHQQIFKERLKRNVGIVSATYTDCMPQMMLEVKPFQKVGAESHENHTLITIMADYDFMQTFQFQLVEGRFFQKSRSMDSSGIILNEAAVRSLDYKEPLREELIWMGLKKRKMNVIGVIRDFHIESMHTEIRPMSVLLMRNRPGEFLSVRIARDNIPEILKYIREQWNQIVPQQPLEYLFFDDQFAQLYQIEIQSGKVFTTFAVLAIFIACLGLFGLASFTVVKRTKEIGIRKVLGASVPNIFFLLSKEFSRWVILSNIIAWPVAWYFMNKWLENFAYRINIHWWFFVIAGLVALLISLITIIWQALRTATANPADSLRYE